MFNPTQADVRRFFCAAHAKQQAGGPMEAIETLAGLWIAEHPEYHADLADANLFGTIANKADFAGADLSDVNFDSSVVRRTNFLGATTTLHTTFFSAVFCRTVWTNGTKLNYHC